VDNLSYRGASRLCDELDVALKGSYVHTVEEEGIFVINTRLWWHQTEIPGTCIDTARTSGNATNLSISYARHCIHLDETQLPAGDEGYISMRDGAWDIAFITKGTILFTKVGVDPARSLSSKRADANYNSSLEKIQITKME